MEERGVELSKLRAVSEVVVDRCKQLHLDHRQLNMVLVSFQVGNDGCLVRSTSLACNVLNLRDLLFGLITAVSNVSVKAEEDSVHVSHTNRDIVIAALVKRINSFGEVLLEVAL